VYRVRRCRATTTTTMTIARNYCLFISLPPPRRASLRQMCHYTRRVINTARHAFARYLWGDTNRLIYSQQFQPRRRCVKTFTIHRFTAAATNDSLAVLAPTIAPTGGACTVRGANAIKSAVVRLLCRAAIQLAHSKFESRRRLPRVASALPLRGGAFLFRARCLFVGIGR